MIGKWVGHSGDWEVGGGYYGDWEVDGVILESGIFILVLGMLVVDRAMLDD